MYSNKLNLVSFNILKFFSIVPIEPIVVIMTSASVDGSLPTAVNNGDNPAPQQPPVPDSFTSPIHPN